MLGNDEYYFGTLEKMDTYFGAIFNDIIISRQDADGITIVTSKVPLQHARKDKQIARTDMDADLQRGVQVILPRMSFMRTGMRPDPDRQLAATGMTVRKSSDKNRFKRVFNPVPYIFDYELSIYVKNTEDGLRIVEQILPFFRPAWTASVNILPEMNLSLDLPIELVSINNDDNVTTAGIAESRRITWTLQFAMQTFLFGPVTNKKIIKVSKMQFLTPPGEIANSVGQTDVIGRLTTQPGLTSNGEPTSDITQSVDWQQIAVDDPYGYIITNEGMVMTQ